MAEYKELIYEKIGKKALITLNRPEKLNALSINLKQEIMKALDEAGNDKEVRVVVLTGSGDRAFCAGQELTETRSTDISKAETEAYTWILGFKNLYEAFRRQSKVVIAMINGVATGSGLQITLLCDFRIMSANARIGVPEIDVGYPLITGSGLLWDIIGPAKTKDLALTGRLISADEALSWGLVNKIFPHEELREKTLEFANFLTEKAPVATAVNKAFYRAIEAPLFHEAFEHAVIGHTQGYASGEPQEYQKKFFEKRRERKTQH